MNPDRIAAEYRYLTTAALAAKYGKTPCAMRQWLSREGISDPKRQSVRERKALYLKLRGRGSNEEIAEYLDMSRDAFRAWKARHFKGPGEQLELWPADFDWGTPKAHPPMRIIHVASRPDCKQLELELFPQAEHVKAA